MAPEQETSLYREAALRKAASPDQLDRLVRVTRPTGWLALLAVGAVIGASVAWGVYGTVPTRVDGSGILFGTSGAVVDVQARVGGRVVAILVKAGDHVEPDQAVARVERQDIALSLRQAQAYVDELRAQRDQTARYYDAYQASQEGNFKAQLENLRGREQDARETRLTARQNAELRGRDAQDRLQRLETLLKGQEELARQGFIARIQVDQTLSDVGSAREALAQARADALQAETTAREALDQVRADRQALDIKRLEIVNQRTQALDAFVLKIVDAEQKVAQLTQQLRDAVSVVSPVRGQVAEVVVQAGAIVADLAVITKVDVGGRGIEALIYVPADRGKEVRTGQLVQVVPTTVRKEEFGYIHARVEGVAELPSTSEGMLAILGNRDLVTTFLASGPKIAITVDLLEDPRSRSGYRWSSGAGPDLKISRGTLASGQIIVREQPPVTLVIPALKKFFGLV
jgi:HlyD family secretion protein